MTETREPETIHNYAADVTRNRLRNCWNVTIYYTAHAPSGRQRLSTIRFRTEAAARAAVAPLVEAICALDNATVGAL